VSLPGATATRASSSPPHCAVQLAITSPPEPLCWWRSRVPSSQRALCLVMRRTRGRP